MKTAKISKARWTYQRKQTEDTFSRKEISARYNITRNEECDVNARYRSTDYSIVLLQAKLAISRTQVMIGISFAVKNIIHSQRHSQRKSLSLGIKVPYE
jgi:hypothetical protein